MRRSLDAVASPKYQKIKIKKKTIMNICNIENLKGGEINTRGFSIPHLRWAMMNL